MNIPIFVPIHKSFDREFMLDELLNSGIFNEKKVATSTIKDGKSRWDNGKHFKSDTFSKLTDIPYWDSEEENKKLTASKMNTFFQVNITKPDVDNTLSDSWKGSFQERSRVPLWISDDRQWKYRDDYDLPYLQEVIYALDLDYISMVRIVMQEPPSIGLIHRDNGPLTNQTYYDNGGVTITLNVCSGGANLYFVDSSGQEQTIDEDNTPVWHFNDAALHCTNEVKSRRVQIRVYGHKSNYQNLFSLDKAVY